MAIIIQEITVEVAKPNHFQALVAKEGDINSRFLKVTFAHNGEKIEIMPTSSARISGSRPDGQSKIFGGEVNNDGTATVPLTAWMLELPGMLTCDVTIVDTEGRKLSSTSFNVKVDAAACDNQDLSVDDSYDILTTIANDAKAILTEEFEKAKAEGWFKGDPGYTPVKGIDYVDGKNGESVAITKITQSILPGGISQVVFSDGNILKIYNGTDGDNASFNVTGSKGQMLVVKRAQASGLVAEWEAVSRTHWEDDTGLHKLPNKFLSLDWLPVLNKPGELIAEHTFGDSHMFTELEYNALNVGETYVVTWDDNSYICECISVGDETKTLGNLSLVAAGENTKEPFLVIVMPTGEDYYNAVAFSDLEAVNGKTMGVYTLGGEVDPMPVNFLPSGVPHPAKDIERIPEQNLTLFTDPTFGYVAAVRVNPQLVIGHQYEVTFNGGTYNCVAVASPLPDYRIGLGNLSLVGGSGNGEPFIIGIPREVVNGFYAHIIALDGSADTVSLRVVEKNAVPEEKLPAELMPDDLTEIILRSSTPGSTKRFKLTVNDSGTVYSTEV